MVIRVFRMFDYTHKGNIRQQEFRILDNSCVHLTDEEFHRWGFVFRILTQQIAHQICAAAQRVPSF